MKGRNPHLIQLRNEYLIKRYYYWHELNQIRRDIALHKLSREEVFLEVFTIESILRECYHFWKEIKAKKPTEKQLQNFTFTATQQPEIIQTQMAFA
jgi:hypothetical protein